jgi:intracellular sulfur oxidation DsrE/DsrF family protein
VPLHPCPGARPQKFHPSPGVATAESQAKETEVKIAATLATVLVTAALAQPALADTLAPYGTAKVDMHSMPVTNTVFDVNYEDPQKLNTLYYFILNTKKVTNGKVVVVTHGPELRAFAKENYEKYKGIIDRMAELSKDGVEFKMCNNAMKAAGFKAEDMHGFITVVPAGFPEVAYWQGKGYKYINPLPLAVKDVRYIDQPGLKK